MNSLNYLLQTNLYLILFMGFYTLVLRNETFFRQNRIYLNGSIILSFVIPFINTPWFRELFITQTIRESAIMPTQYIYDTVVVGVNEDASAWSIADLLICIYLGGALIFFLRFLIKLILLRSNLKAEKGSAFSFFNQLVVDNELPNAETIIDHEKVHIRQWHSADIILTEIAAILNWFNPVVYLYKKEIRHIHEFIADEEASNLMNSKSNYALLLFSNTMGIDPHQLINNFFNKSLLKRRINMLYKNKSRSTGLWKYGFSAPLFALMLILSAAGAETEKPGFIAETSDLISPLETKRDLTVMATSVQASKISGNKINTGSSVKKPVKISSVKKSKPEDFTTLWSHIKKNIQYPESAKQNRITGYEVVNFKLQNGKISNVTIAKSLQNDIDNEVLRTFNLFKESIQAEDNNYSMAIDFRLTGIEPDPGQLPSTGKNQFLGSITVISAGPNYALSKVVIKDFTETETLPEFQGGLTGWTDYIRNTLKYPEEAKKNQVQGRVIVSFIVMKDGSLNDIKVLRGIGSGADEEAIRVLKASPKWKPGMEKGEAVNVAYTMPIFFKLPEPKTN